MLGLGSLGPLGLLSYRSVGGTPAVGSTKLRLNLIMRLEPGLRLPIVTHGCAPELRATELVRTKVGVTPPAQAARPFGTRDWVSIVTPMLALEAENVDY